MGLSATEAHPSWMILTVLPVPPPPVRPSISVDGGAMRGEDDLTYKLAEIIRANSSLRKFEEEGAPAHVINEFEQLLQCELRKLLHFGETTLKLELNGPIAT